MNHNFFHQFKRCFVCGRHSLSRFAIVCRLLNWEIFMLHIYLEQKPMNRCISRKNCKLASLWWFDAIVLVLFLSLSYFKRVTQWTCSSLKSLVPHIIFCFRQLGCLERKINTSITFLDETYWSSCLLYATRFWSTVHLFYVPIIRSL